MKYLLLLAMAVLMLLGLGGCEKDAWKSMKPLLTDAVISAALSAKADPGVLEALSRQDFDAVATRGIRVMKVELRNAAAGWATGGNLEKKAHNYINANWPVIGAMIARPGDEGLYWRLDRWLVGKGHVEGVRGGLLTIKLSSEERDELYPLILEAVEEEFVAAREYMDK